MSFESVHFKMMNWNQIKEILSQAQNIVILVHSRPDGDAIGSALALQYALEDKGKKVRIISPDSIPSFLMWLPGSEKILDFSTNPEDGEKTLKNADLIFMVDFNRFSRTGKNLEKLLEEQIKNKPFIMIDHHLQPDERIPYRFSDPDKASSAELMYEFLKFSGLTNQPDSKIATALYTGILTDTGSFRFDKTTFRTHDIVSGLIRAGADNARIYSNVFDTYSYEKLQLLGEAIRRMKVVPDCATSYMVLDQKTLEKFHYKPGDTEGIVNYGLMIEGIKLTALITEKPGENTVRFSLRSKGNFDVNDFARKYFNGGGHKNAAGGNFDGSIEEAVKKFVKLVQENCQEIKNA